MTLNKIKLKTAFMITYSISYWLLFTLLSGITTYAFAINGPDKTTGGFIAAMILLGLLITVISGVIAYAIAFLPYKDRKDYGVITGGLLLMKRKWKFVSHSDLGYYLLVFDGVYSHLYEFRWFSLKYIMEQDLRRINYDSEKLSNMIKSHLDSLYKVRLAEIRTSEETKRGINNLVNKWDGYLDKVSRRDSKIDEILK